MKKRVRIFSLLLTSLLMSGCCFRVGSITIGKDCNKGVYCKDNPLNVDYNYNVKNDYSELYSQCIKSVVTIIGQASQSNHIITSSGSGVVFQEDTNYVYIVTNNHVVSLENTNYVTTFDSFEVIFSDYKRVSGELLARANGLDIAVIRVLKEQVGNSYSVAEVENSLSAVKIGQPAIVLGSPLGLNHAFSLTIGSISSLYSGNANFSNIRLGSYSPIMISAAVNPGNSGGGLFNDTGKLIGIVQGGHTKDENDNTLLGINYAISAPMAINVAKNLVSSGTYVKPSFDVLDIYLLDISNLSLQEIADYHLSETMGLFIRAVVSNGNAQKAGIGSNFIMESVDNITITSLGLWNTFLSCKNIGDTIVIKGHYLGSNEVVTYNVVLN